MSSETALFATSMTTGIVDLGASQTVMGQHQLDEFLCNVPAAIRPLIQERKISMSFRFGNNSIVPCHRAILVPVDRFLISIDIVESKTPFLISNSVCRNLRAVIDTTKQTIVFRELQCTLPLTLSGKNLFLMDFCELLEKKPPRQTETDCQKKQPAETVLNCHAAESDSTDPKSFQEPQASDLPAQMFFPDHVTDQSVLISSDTSVHLQLPSQPSDHHVKCPVQPEFDRTFRCHPELREKDHPGGPTQADATASALRDDDRLRTDQAGPEIWRSDQHRSSLLPMVPGKVRRQQEDGTPHICALSESLDRSKGAGTRAADPAQCQSRGKGPSLTGSWETITTVTHSGSHRSGRRGDVGRDSDVPIREARRGGECPSFGSGRRSTVSCSDATQLLTNRSSEA